jgi:hypothetical protein
MRDHFRKTSQWQFIERNLRESWHSRTTCSKRRRVVTIESKSKTRGVTSEKTVTRACNFVGTSFPRRATRGTGCSSSHSQWEDEKRRKTPSRRHVLSSKIDGKIWIRSRRMLHGGFMNNFSQRLMIVSVALNVRVSKAQTCFMTLLKIQLLK